MKIAVIGQGFVGRAYSDWFESRGLKVTRYSLEPRYSGNRHAVADCDVVVVAVPTPTGRGGQDTTAVTDSVRLSRPGATVLVKSTVLPGTTDALQAEFPDRKVAHVPEFLRANHAADDVAHPSRTVVGIPDGSERGEDIVRLVVDLFPRSSSLFRTNARTAEFIKYAANILLISKLVTANALYDAAPEGVEWPLAARALEADPRIGPSHLQPVAAGKRGAGGGCFVKDIAAFNFTRMNSFLCDIEDENRRLLEGTGKDLGILSEVYGPDEVAA